MPVWQISERDIDGELPRHRFALGDAWQLDAFGARYTDRWVLAWQAGEPWEWTDLVRRLRRLWPLHPQAELKAYGALRDELPEPGRWDGVEPLSVNALWLMAQRYQVLALEGVAPGVELELIPDQPVSRREQALRLRLTAMGSALALIGAQDWLRATLWPSGRALDETDTDQLIRSLLGLDFDPGTTAPVLLEH